MDEENRNTGPTEDEIKEQEGQEAGSKVAHAGLKGAATYFGGAAGNAAYNLADKLGVTKPVENVVGKAVDSVPGLNKAARGLNKSGALDAADQAIDLASGKGGGLGKETLAKETLAKDTIDSGTKSGVGAESASGGTTNGTTNGKSNAGGSGTVDAKRDKNSNKWIWIIGGIILFLPFILIILVVGIVAIGFLAPGLGVSNFFSGIKEFFMDINDERLQKAENSYYEHLEEAQNTAFLKYNVCIDVNLIHATLTVNKLGDQSLDEGSEVCTDADTCSNSAKDVLTVADYRKMEKYIDLLANMQIKRKKYAVYKKECYLSSEGDRCTEKGENAKEELVTEDNLDCADISWLDGFDLAWNGIPFRDSSTPRLVASNDKENNSIFSFLSKKANRERNYEYYLYIPEATYEKDNNNNTVRKCYLNAPQESTALDIGSWTDMENHVYFYNLLDSFVEEYYKDYLTGGSGQAEVGSKRYNDAKDLIDKIYDYYNVLGPNQSCRASSNYICRSDEGSDYFGGGETSLNRSEFIDKIAPVAIEEMSRTGVPASITIAQAAVESRNGSSKLSTKYSNYYGMTAGSCAPSSSPSTSSGTVLASGEAGNNCGGNVFWNGSVVAMCNSSGGDCQWYRVYDSFTNSTKDHSRLLSESYGCNQSNYQDYLTCVVDKGYASAQNYKSTLSATILNNNLVQYDIGSFSGTVTPVTDIQFSNNLCNELGMASGDWQNWKQYDPAWASVPLGPSTVGKIGCAMTSVAMQIMRSGVSTTLGADFNPGTFAQALRQVGGFDSRGNINWGAVSNIAPGFKWTGRVRSGVDPGTIGDLVSQGYYVILNVKNGRHWVAVDRVEGNKIYMYDPGSGGTEVGQTYGLSSIVGYTTYRKG